MPFKKRSFIASKISPLDVFVGKKLRELRLKSDLSQDKLGELVGLTFQQIHKYETGVNRITAGKLYEISQVMEKPIAMFFEDYTNDDFFYNFVPMQEDDLIACSKDNYKKVNDLIKNFNKIKSSEVQKNILNLVKSLGRQ